MAEQNQNGPPKHHFEKAHVEDGVFVETETKIKYFGTRSDFAKQMNSLHAMPVKDTRLIDDLRFSANEKLRPRSVYSFSPEIVFQKKEQSDFVKVSKIFELLGFTVKQHDSHNFKIESSETSQKTIRLRNDGGVWVFTVKKDLNPQDENASNGIQKKEELEIELNDPTELRNLLNKLGFSVSSHRQKYRTSYKLKSGQIVELNESPALNKFDVPFWIEIEAENEPAILDAAKQLGFNKEHFFKGSDKKFIKNNSGKKVKEAELNELLF